MNGIINYSGENFDNEVVSETGLTLVDFYAIWCGPCQMLEKVLVEVSNNSDCKIVRIDVDDYPEFGSKFKIRGLPTLLLFKESEIVETLNGFKTFFEAYASEHKVALVNIERYYLHYLYYDLILLRTNREEMLSAVNLLKSYFSAEAAAPYLNKTELSVLFDSVLYKIRAVIKKFIPKVLRERIKKIVC